EDVEALYFAVLRQHGERFGRCPPGEAGGRHQGPPQSWGGGCIIRSSTIQNSTSPVTRTTAQMRPQSNRRQRFFHWCRRYFASSVTTRTRCPRRFLLITRGLHPGDALDQRPWPLVSRRCIIRMPFFGHSFSFHSFSFPCSLLSHFSD